MQIRKHADKTGTQPPEGQPWPLKHIEVMSAPKIKKFSTGFVQRAQTEGWLTVGRGVLTIHAEPDDVSYQIKRGPGYFCSHCGQELDGEVEARAHVAANHDGEISPDPENPSGYEKADFYDCEKLEA